MSDTLMRRVLADKEPFMDKSKFEPGWAWGRWGDWPVWWIDHPERTQSAPSVALFRLKFKLEKPGPLRIHVSADNRYRLYVDGSRIGEGPERGDAQHWFFESYEGRLPAGEHSIIVQTWWLGDKAPFAQMSLRPGFMLASEGELLEKVSTGHARWETAIMPGLDFIPHGDAWGGGWKLSVNGPDYPWGWETGHGNLKWTEAVKIAQAMSAAWKNEIPPHWLLMPAGLPAMRNETSLAGALRYLTSSASPYPVDETRQLSKESSAWQNWLSGKSALTIPANTARTAVIDLENYYCAYPELLVSGGKGSRIRFSWAEGLFLKADGGGKGHRDQIDGKFFRGGVGDEFLPDGGKKRLFTTLWWEAGRYVEVSITTGPSPLVLEKLSLRCTGYPMKMEGRFDTSEPAISRFLPIAERAIQMCSHETYMDCPYYEQLMYIGDTRLEVLTTYAMTPDDRLPRKALQMFDWSRRNSGLTQSRYPSRVCQIIPPFSLWWVCMVHDYWMWRDDQSFVKERMAGVRAVTEAFRSLIREDGLIDAPNGWNFTDWVKEPVQWTAGIPAKTDFEPNSILNLHFALTLKLKAEMESSFGEEQLAVRDLDTAKRITKAVLKHFWDKKRAMLADDLKHQHFSEHAQCLALLGGFLDKATGAGLAKSLASSENISRTTIYFTHYLFETYKTLDLPALFFERLKLWSSLDEHGFKTTFEEPEPSRSDCHAWGAHPLFHCYATILGIRPDAPGFRSVRIAPMPGDLKKVSGTMPHPKGEIAVSLEIGPGCSLSANVKLPAGVKGVFEWRGIEKKLNPGKNIIRFKG